MIEKEAYIDTLTHTAAIFSNYTFLKENLNSLAELKAAVNDFAFRVILIGGFSSGKSALLNRLTERELFKENLGPETAIPAEVSWAPVESAHAGYADGSVQVIDDISTATATPPQNALFISLHLDSPFLKQRPELVLVDFPGFDSNVEAHNNAINAYLKKGSAFILLVPAQNGTLGQSDIRFLKEAAYYPQALEALISKVDLVPEQKRQEIVDYVRSGIASVYGVEVPVMPISTKLGSEKEFAETIGTVVDRFNPQELFDLSLAPAINEQLHTGIDALEQYMAASTLDSREIDGKIAQAKETQQELARQLEKERRALDSKYAHEIIPGIISNLDRALHDNLDTLTDAALMGEQHFADAVQSVVRPILAGVSGEIQANLRDVIGRMSFETTPGAPDNSNDKIREALLNIVDVISTVIPSLGGGTGKQAPGKSAKVPSSVRPGANLGNMMSGMGTGLIVGATLNPILGVLVALAPALIEIFFASRGRQSQPDPRVQVRAQIEAQAIPSILSRLESQVTPAVMETRDMMFEEIKNKISESMHVAAEAMELARKEKEGLVANHASSMEQMQHDVDELKSLIIDKRQVA